MQSCSPAATTPRSIRSVMSGLLIAVRSPGSVSARSVSTTAPPLPYQTATLNGWSALPRRRNRIARTALARAPATPGDIWRKPAVKRAGQQNDADHAGDDGAPPIDADPLAEKKWRQDRDEDDGALKKRGRLRAAVWRGNQQAMAMNPKAILIIRSAWR